MGRVIDVEVLADPGSCETTAVRLTRLGQACGLAAVQLDRQALVGEEDFGGLSGVVYRQSLAELARTCGRLANDCGRLGSGLAEYARDITEVRRLMGEALAVAAPQLLTCAWAIWSPVQPNGPDDPDLAAKWAAWHAAVGWWRRARALEDAAEQQWLHVLGRAPAPAPYDENEPPVPVEETVHQHHDRSPFDPATTMASAPAPRSAR